MRFEKLTKHSVDEDILASKIACKLLETGYPFVYAVDELKLNADGVYRYMIYLVQVRDFDMRPGSHLSREQQRILGWTGIRLVRCMLNVDPHVLAGFDEEDQEKYHLKGVWYGYIIRVFEQLHPPTPKAKPKMVYGTSYKIYEKQLVYERTTIASMTDKSEVDFKYNLSDCILAKSIVEFTETEDAINHDPL